jgi:tetratricopeptide (TPR) repeat protein
MKINALLFTPAFNPGNTIPRKEIARVESLNRPAIAGCPKAAVNAPPVLRSSTAEGGQSRRFAKLEASWQSRQRMECGVFSTAFAPRFNGKANVTTDNRRAGLLVFLAAIVWIFTGGAMAADFSAGFNAANKLYAEGKFAEAAADYEKILQTSSVSPALYFNYGNAEFKSGNLGRAIAAYRRAAQLAPRDAEVRANLDFARNQVSGPTRRESRWANWLGTLTLNEWTGLTAIAFWLLFGLLAARQLRPALKPALRNLTLGAVMATLLAGACLGIDAALHFSGQTVVIVEPDVTARSGPFDEAQSAFAVHNGAELAVLDRRNDWLQVTDGSGRIGWLPQKLVELLPGS